MKKKFIWLALLIALVLGLYFLHPFIMEGAARFFIVEDKLQPADFIIVLGGDTQGERVEEAVELYRRGYANKVLMAGGTISWHVIDARVMKDHAVALGMPPEDIMLEKKSQSTIDNAKFTLPLVKENKGQTVIVVTSPMHSRRARRVFKKVYSQEKIKVLLHPVPLAKSKFKPERWWERHEDSARVIWEGVANLGYFIKGY